MKRWSLAKQLRALSRDWTILPTTTSSTDRAVLGNLFDHPPDAQAAAAASEREALARRSEPSLRWRMRETEGTWWLGYRPVVRVELITPGRITVRPSVVVASAVEVEVRETVGGGHEGGVGRAEAVAGRPGDHELPGYEA